MSGPAAEVVRAELFRRGGPDEAFRLTRTAPERLERPDLVRIRVRACGVNFADVMMRMGLYPEAPPLPFTPGYEVSGEVIEVGEQVTRVRVGERVMAGCYFGGYASEVLVPEGTVRAMPPNLSFEEAAGVPVAFLTAWIALVEMGRVRAGDRVLIQSAAGGVGSAAVQIAAQRGAHVVGLTGSPGKRDAILGLGAREAVLAREWEAASDFEAIRAHGAFDLILDSEGGPSLRRAYARLASGGRVVSFGVSSMVPAQRRSILRSLLTLGRTPFFHPLKLMNDNRGVFGLNLLKLFTPESGGLIYRAFDQIIAELARGTYRIPIGRTFPLAEAGAAQAFLQSRGATGKIILIP